MTEYEPKDSIIQRMSAAAADLHEALDIRAEQAERGANVGNDAEHEAAFNLLGAVDEFLAKRERTLEEVREAFIQMRDGMSAWIAEAKAEVERFRNPQEPEPRTTPSGQHEHTATTRHLVDVTVTVPGDNGIDPEYLVEVLMWGLEQHNAAVERLGTKADEDGDHIIQPVAMNASGDIGLGGERAAFCHDPEGSDFTYFGVEGASLRRCEEGDEPSDEDILLKF